MPEEINVKFIPTFTGCIVHTQSEDTSFKYEIIYSETIENKGMYYTIINHCN